MPEAEVQRQQPTPEVGARQLTEVGSQLKEAQAQMNTAASRTQDLDQQTRRLSKDLEAQWGAASDSQARFEERARAAYKGEDLAGLSLVLDSVLNGDSVRMNTVLNGTTARLLAGSRGIIKFNRDSNQALQETLRQLNQKKEDYRRLREAQQARDEALRQRDAQLRVSVGGLGTKKEQMEERIVQLEAAEEAGELTTPPASRVEGSTETQEQELQIASEDIVAREVGPIPYERYVQIYKAAAKRYEFAKDWYVLAAVGKAESNHGENMGRRSEHHGPG
ncbi:MAG: hypothetical protein LC751_07040 [Actinobacteria bacterium]|nr:hypothetical protein [Actinomycetota bacterium]